MKITKKDYEEGKINATPIENCRKYFNFLSKNIDMVIHLNADNRVNFKKLWGKPHWYFRGSEFYFHVWVKEFESETFLILTAKDKGTCIEVVSKHSTIDSKGKKIISFAKQLYSQLKEN